jgi:hypothetical protein
MLTWNVQTIDCTVKVHRIATGMPLSLVLGRVIGTQLVGVT